MHKLCGVRPITILMLSVFIAASVAYMPQVYAGVEWTIHLITLNPPGLGANNQEKDEKVEIAYGSSKDFAVTFEARILNGSTGKVKGKITLYDEDSIFEDPPFGSDDPLVTKEFEFDGNCINTPGGCVLTKTIRPFTLHCSNEGYITENQYDSDKDAQLYIWFESETDPLPGTNTNTGSRQEWRNGDLDASKCDAARARGGDCVGKNVQVECVKKITGAPTVTEWGLIALGLLLAGSLAWMIRRRFSTRPAGA